MMFSYPHSVTRLPTLNNIFQSPTVQFGWVYEEIIDIDLLKRSLHRLIAEKWKLLGGRIVENKRGGQGGLHLLVPSEYSDAVPAFTYGHRDFSERLEEIYKIPSPSADNKEATIFPMSNDSIFNPSPEYSYRTSQEMTGRDQPIIHLQTAVFEGDRKSAVGICVPHTFFDAGGVAHVIDALNTIMKEDSLDNVPDSINDIFLLDTLKTAEEVDKAIEHGWTPNTPHIFSPDDQPKSKNPLQAALEEGNESRMMFLPDDQIKALKEECNQYLAEQGKGEWVSSGDVTYAWIWKNIYSSVPSDYPMDQLVQLHTTADGRRRIDLAKIAGQPGAIWLPLFLTFYSTAFDSIHALLDAHLGEVAVRIRRLIKSHLGPEQVALSQAFATKAFFSREDRKAFVSAADPSFDVTAWTNWTVYDFQGKGRLDVPRRDRSSADDTRPVQLKWFNGNSTEFEGMPGMVWVLCNTEVPRRGTWCSVNLPTGWFDRGAWVEMSSST